MHLVTGRRHVFFMLDVLGENKKHFRSVRTFEDDNYNCLIDSKIINQAGIELISGSEPPVKQWYVMRDLKRVNAKLPAYKQLASLGMDIFTPMRWRLTVKGNRRIREEVPFIQDLLFVHETRERLDCVVSQIPTLQYRYQKGRPYCEPMKVPEDEMQRFIHAVNSTESPQYYLPKKLTSAVCGRRIRIVGGALDGYEGRLLTIRGSRVKRILVELPTWIVAAIEINPEYIQLL